jgi:DNA-binding transcriptional MerR regulator
MAGLRIGDLARLADVPTSTIRYYERIGLLGPKARSGAGYRLYSEQSVDEVQFIRRAQALGFSLPEITEILGLSRAGKTPCSRVVDLAKEHLTALDARLKRLTAFRKQLGKAVDSWDAGRCGFTAKGLCSLIDLVDSPYPERAARKPKKPN